MKSIGIKYSIIGHSEKFEDINKTNLKLKDIFFSMPSPILYYTYVYQIHIIRFPKNITLNWNKIIGIIKDFFKAAKGAFGLGKFHRFTDKSMYKNIYLCLLLTTIVVQTGFKTKTQLQQLAEGKIEFQPLKKKNTKK